MLKIRLKRFGRKKHPSYRIIVIDSKKPRDGRAIEEVGFYHPITNQMQVNLEKIQQRINHGAQLTKKVQNIIQKVKSSNY
uniref:Ribosomal protein S16 n=2 Tax=Gracilariopsis TaxID=2781 RepID=A0A1C9CF20_9FLOR|nr:ribosomal protein S16 [Gracilariopsis lemaneiformis]YP_009294740.1 ribosomal protein S16 [Gracilariopsis chorda]AJO68382.1 30S ribosomal protein S16 [Gracilariopsis lemaneiformis]AML79913.1 ribosomal protein S16 [Gracilariopsis lemaneiformis]AOM67000.1 ribosomal protein S16 [Gracilariopsis chorda]UAD88942.1 ribosomal protein S16 [Gracilariopsis chorda]